MTEKNNEDFEVTLGTKINDDTVLFTSVSELTKNWLEEAVKNYNPKNSNYSTYLKDIDTNVTLLDDEKLDTLSLNPQSDLSKVKQINTIARYYINKDDLIGKVYETIESNVNTDYEVTYKDFKSGKDKKIAKEVKFLIEEFNQQINLKELIRKSIPLAYSEGNYPMYLRSSNNTYTVDYYPLGVVEVSDYEINGEPYLLFNTKELTTRLKKVNKKNKDGTFLFFGDTEQEIKNSYPKEVYDAVVKKNEYAKLNINCSGILRINNMNRKYGITPIFRTFRPAMMLEVFEKSDKTNTQAKGKKIIFQKLRKEILGQDYTKKAFEEMAYSHDAFLEAWKNKIVIYTGAGWVENIQYIEPKIENTNIETIGYYRNKIMTNLGIAFLDSTGKNTFATSQISIKELMKTINKITEQLENVIRKWYRFVLQENNIPSYFCPDIKIIDSELLEMELRIQLADTLFNKFGMSFKSTFEMLGRDFEHEKLVRKLENEELLDKDVFYPRATGYTHSSKGKEDYDSEGRPIDNNDPDKQIQDQNRRGTT